jgi:hypothetical protein
MKTGIINQLEGLKNLSNEDFETQKKVLSKVPIKARIKLYCSYASYSQLKYVCIEEIKVGQIEFVDLILIQLKKMRVGYRFKLERELKAHSFDNPNF